MSNRIRYATEEERKEAVRASAARTRAKAKDRQLQDDQQLQEYQLKEENGSPPTDRTEELFTLVREMKTAFEQQQVLLLKELAEVRKELAELKETVNIVSDETVVRIEDCCSNNLVEMKKLIPLPPKRGRPAKTASPES